MIVPVLLKIGTGTAAEEYSVDGLNLSTKPANRTYSLQATMLDLDTGDFRTYAFKSVHQGEADDVGLFLNRGQVDDQMRQLRAGLDRWLGDEIGHPIDLERVKDFIRSASNKDVGAVMGVCLGQLDKRGEADIVTLLRELTAMVERMVADLANGGGEQ